MKRLVTISGALILAVGIFYDAMPVELFGSFWQMLQMDSRPVHFRIVSTGQVDVVQFFFLFVGAVLVLAGMLIRSKKSSS